MEIVSKSTSLNLRITPQFRAEIQALADFHGLTLSSMAHSLLVKAVRDAMAKIPDGAAFNIVTKPIDSHGPMTNDKKPSKRKTA